MRDWDLDHEICQLCRFGDAQYGHDVRDPQCREAKALDPLAARKKAAQVIEDMLLHTSMYDFIHAEEPGDRVVTGIQFLMRLFKVKAPPGKKITFTRTKGLLEIAVEDEEKKP